MEAQRHMSVGRSPGKVLEFPGMFFSFSIFVTFESYGLKTSFSPLGWIEIYLEAQKFSFDSVSLCQLSPWAVLTETTQDLARSGGGSDLVLIEKVMD